MSRILRTVRAMRVACTLPVARRLRTHATPPLCYSLRQLAP